VKDDENVWDKNFLPIWEAANLVGSWLVFFVGITVAGAILAFGKYQIAVQLSGVIYGFIFGAFVGLAQYLVIRNKIALSYPSLWVIAAGIGMSIGRLLAMYKVNNAGEKVP
jgi:hypothetical protein